jgi:hypothetical protein
MDKLIIVSLASTIAYLAVSNVTSSLSTILNMF